MGFLKNLVLGAAGLKTYQNVYNKPVVTRLQGLLLEACNKKALALLG